MSRSRPSRGAAVCNSQTAEAWASWDESSSAFRDWVETSLAGPTVDRAVLAELSDKGFAESVRDEQQRQAKTHRFSRHHLSALAARFPQMLRHSLKQLEAAGEVLFGPREVR